MVYFSRIFLFLLFISSFQNFMAHASDVMEAFSAKGIVLDLEKITSDTYINSLKEILEELKKIQQELDSDYEYFKKAHKFIKENRMFGEYAELFGVHSDLKDIKFPYVVSCEKTSPLAAIVFFWERNILKGLKYIRWGENLYINSTSISYDNIIIIIEKILDIVSNELDEKNEYFLKKLFSIININILDLNVGLISNLLHNFCFIHNFEENSIRMLLPQKIFGLHFFMTMNNYKTGSYIENEMKYLRPLGTLYFKLFLVNAEHFKVMEEKKAAIDGLFMQKAINIIFSKILDFDGKIIESKSLRYVKYNKRTKQIKKEKPFELRINSYLTGKVKKLKNHFYTSFMRRNVEGILNYDDETYKENFQKIVNNSFDCTKDKLYKELRELEDKINKFHDGKREKESQMLLDPAVSLEEQDLLIKELLKGDRPNKVKKVNVKNEKKNKNKNKKKKKKKIESVKQDFKLPKSTTAKDLKNKKEKTQKEKDQLYDLMMARLNSEKEEDKEIELKSICEGDISEKQSRDEEKSKQLKKNHLPKCHEESKSTQKVKKHLERFQRIELYLEKSFFNQQIPSFSKVTFTHKMLLKLYKLSNDGNNKLTWEEIVGCINCNELADLGFRVENIGGSKHIISYLDSVSKLELRKEFHDIHKKNEYLPEFYLKHLRNFFGAIPYTRKELLEDGVKRIVLSDEIRKNEAIVDYLHGLDVILH